MTRDGDLLREILFDFEKHKDWAIMDVPLTGGMPEIERTRHGHILLLCDAGLVTRFGSGSMWRLTNAGHDYLEAIRNENVWEKTKEGAAQVGGMTLGMMRDLAVAYLKQEAAEKLGINL